LDADAEFLHIGNICNNLENARKKRWIPDQVRNDAGGGYLWIPGRSSE